MKKMLGSAMGVLAFGGMLAPMLFSSPASAASTIEIKSVNITHCIDELANGSHFLGLTSCEGAANQEWSVGVLTNGAIRFQNASTGACLAEVPGTGVVVTGCNPNSAEQQWINEFGQVNGMTVQQFVSVEVPSGCLNQTGFTVDVETCSSSVSQAWTEVP